MRFTFHETFCDASHYAPLAIAAEKAGYEGFGLSDSIMFPRDSETAYPYLSSGDRDFIGASPTMDPFVLAMHMASVTSIINFVTFVAKLPVRNPVLVAKAVSSIAALSENRFKFGVGLSPWPEDFQVCGQEWKARGKRMDEMVDIIQGLFTGDYFEYHGQFYDLPAIKINPVPSKPLPLYFGGHADAALRRAALRGDGWMHAGGDKDDPIPLIQKLQGYREELGTADKPFAIYAISRDAYTPEGVARLEEKGVTDVVVGFRNVYDPTTINMGVDQKVDMLSTYSDNVIKQL